MNSRYKRLREELDLVNAQLVVVMERMNERVEVMSDKEFDRFVRDLEYPLYPDLIEGKYFTKKQADEIKSIYEKYIYITPNGYNDIREGVLSRMRRRIWWHTLPDNTTEPKPDPLDHSAKFEAMQTQLTDLQHRLIRVNSYVSELRMRRNQPTNSITK